MHIPPATVLTFATLLTTITAVVAQVSPFRPLAQDCGIEPVASATDWYGNGAAAADYDNDGDVDVYLATDRGIPDRLYRNDGAGFFTDVALAAGIDARAGTRAALWFDYDGDGRLDLVLAGEKCTGLICTDPVRLTLYRQRDDFTFTDVTAGAGLSMGTAFDNALALAIGGLAAGDLNQDGYLDLVLTVWGGGVKYFQNTGAGSFVDRTTVAGLSLDHPTPWQPMLHDFNGDGLLDIYCNVDFAANKLWINRGGSFVEQAEAYGLAASFNEMGMAISDYDNDGDLDLYLTNITRLHLGQPQHNVLYEQQLEQGHPRFVERSQGQGVGQSGWDWGTTFLDVDNDSRQDLIATNGWWDERAYAPDASKLWLNTPAGFIDASIRYGFADRYDAGTLIAFDKDRDGDTDFLQTLKNNPGTATPAIVYENTLRESTDPATTHYLTVQPRMAGSNRFAIGSQVTITAEGLRSSRLIHAGCSFYGQEPAEAFFGLGTLTAVREIAVRWPTGETSIYRDLEIDRVIELWYEVIAAPTELTVTPSGNNRAIRWRDNADNETAFVLHRSRDSTFATYTTETVAADSDYFLDTTPDDGAPLFYRLSATNARVSSDYSNPAGWRPVAQNEPGNARNFTVVNPVLGGRLVLTAALARTTGIELSLYDATGRRCWSAEAALTAGVSTTAYDIAVPAGGYWLLIRNGEATEIRPVIFTGF